VADVVDDLLETALEHAVKLDALTVGQAHVAHGLGAQVVMDQPLRRGDASAGHLAADHEAPVLFQFLLAALRAHIAVVLLIGAVVLEQDVAVLGDVGAAGVGKLLGQLAAQPGGLQLDLFNGGFGHGNAGG